jgi:glycosyltransferase involved in cell wall biosynthesis
MILFLRSSDLGIDSRLRRYCRALRLAGIEHSALIWDRTGEALGDGKTPEIRYVKKQGGSGRLAIGLRLIGLNLFALRTMWSMRGQIKLVHAVDLDTALAAWLFNWFSKVPYIYDVYDHYPDSRGIEGRLRQIMDRLERRIIASASRVILADAERTAQHSPIPPERLMIIQNVPDAVQPTSMGSEARPVVNMHLKIGYLGTLERKFRGLEDILAVTAANPGVELHIAGAGSLEPLVKDSAAESKRVIFYGALAHQDGLAMLSRCDVVLGLYYSGVVNHRFAAPNKYFEHLLLGKPMLTSLDTPPGTKVSRDGTGWVIADGEDALAEAVVEMQNNPKLMQKCGENAAKLWQQHYSRYFEQAIAGDYVEALRAITGDYPPSGQVLPFPQTPKNPTECAG